MLPYLRYLLKNSDWKFLLAVVAVLALIVLTLLLYR